MLSPDSNTTSPLIRPDLRRERLALDWSPTDDAEYLVRIADAPDAVPLTPPETFVPIAGLDHWSPESPQLVSLRIERAGDEAPIHEIQIGIRELVLKENRLFLNSRPIPLKAAAVFGHDAPTSTLTRFRDAGFNALWISAGQADDALFDQCDRLGLIVVLETSNAKSALDALQNWGNHPSLGIWVLRDTGPGARETLREQDASRLIWSCTGDSWSYCRPYRQESIPLGAVELSVDAPPDLATRRFARGFGANDSAAFLQIDTSPNTNTETPSDNIVTASGLERLYPAEEALRSAVTSHRVRSAASIISSTRVNANMLGHVWRVPAAWSDADAAIAAEAQTDVAPLIVQGRVTLAPREDMAVEILMHNATRVEGRAELSLLVTSPTRQVLWKKKRGVKLPKAGREMWAGRIEASGAAGEHRFVARLMGDKGRIGESSNSFFVHAHPEPWNGAVNVIDPNRHWTESITPWVWELSAGASIHIIPPLSNKIAGYPDNELAQVVASVADGAVAVFFGPPDDWNTFADFYNEDIHATSVALSGDAHVAQFARLHPVFDALPVPALLNDSMAGMAPHKRFAEKSDEDIAGAIVGTDGLEAVPTFLVRRLGEGRIVFTHWRVLERLGVDPVAERIFVNLLRHVTRRAVPLGNRLKINQAAVEWMRGEQAERLQHWRVMGVFHDPGGRGIDTAFPPEGGFDEHAAYPGEFGLCTWRDVHAATDAPLQVFDLATNGTPHTHWRHGVVYAQANVTAEARGDAVLQVEHRAACRIWLGDQVVYEAGAAEDAQPPVRAAIDVFVRQGRNPLLVKLSYSGEQDYFNCAIERKDGLPGIRWGR